MATKKLSRTILEAGAATPQKIDEWRSKRKERADNRAFLNKIKNDPEEAERNTAPKRGGRVRTPDDKLGPVHRFIESWVGRPWDKCYSEMKRKFNPKSLPGYHIIYDHILREIYKNEDELNARSYYRGYRTEYYVDNEGILRKTEPIKYRTRSKYNFGPVSSWLGNRKLTILGNHYYWFIGNGKCQWKNLNDIAAYNSDGFIDGFQPAVKLGKRWIPAKLSFRQGKRLNKKELAHLQGFPRWLIDEILMQSPDKIQERKKNYWDDRAKQKARRLYDFNHYSDI